jgi:hypothetical protein
MEMELKLQTFDVGSEPSPDASAEVGSDRVAPPLACEAPCLEPLFRELGTASS